MLIPTLAGLVLFFGFGFFMLCQERPFLLNRARHAEAGERTALKAAMEATEKRGAVERDALALAAQNEQCREQNVRLTAHIHMLLRRSSQLQSLQPATNRTYDIKKAQCHIEATRSAHLN